MIQYGDAHAALLHAYRIRAHMEATPPSLGGYTGGGGAPLQEWIAHASFIVRDMRDYLTTPDREAVECFYSSDNLEIAAAARILAGEICPPGCLAFVSVWARPRRMRPGAMRHLSEETGIPVRTLQRHGTRTREALNEWAARGVYRMNRRFRRTGIVRD